MARGVNKVILIGNVGGEPEVRYMPNGNAVTTLSIATSETWKEKDTGNKQERTEWHRVVCFNKLGEIAGEYVRKGSKLYIEGSLRTRKWQDAQGQDRYTTEIIASDFQMLDSKASSSSYGDMSPAPQYENQAAFNKPQATSAPQASPHAAFDMDEDVPF